MYSNYIIINLFITAILDNLDAANKARPEMTTQLPCNRHKIATKSP